MISVLGEALVDLVITPDGAVAAKLGGAPFNTARACGRLGADVRFIGAISEDRFGSMLAQQLIDDHVDASAIVRVQAPTTLASAELDDRGTATYRFYIAGTSAPSLVEIEPDALDGDMVFTGGLGLVLEPMAAAIETALAALQATVRDARLVMIDVNCRPKITPDRHAYVARIERVIRSADVVKASDEDLDYLRPDVDPMTSASEFVETGPSAVLLTRGGDGVHVVTAAGSVLVPVDAVSVVDTIGAGDTFSAGFLSWWRAAGLTNSDATDLGQLQRAVRAANTAAGVVVTRRGADPPWRTDLADDWAPT